MCAIGMGKMADCVHCPARALFTRPSTCSHALLINQQGSRSWGCLALACLQDNWRGQF